jgi:hypothetical protein
MICPEGNMYKKNKILFLPFIFIVSVILINNDEKNNSYYSFSDNFKSYEAGADAYPAWYTETFNWQIKDNTFYFKGKEKDFALCNISYYGKKVVVEAEMKVNKAIKSDWKIGGICIQLDQNNFWQLALVEKPDRDGKGHFVELAEMYQGQWCANFNGDTKLEVEYAETGFNWQYDHPYTLILELGLLKITGLVYGLNGKLTAKISYLLKNNAVTCGRPGLVGDGLELNYSHFKTSVDDIIAMKPVSFPAYFTLSKTKIMGTSTGFFHTEKIRDTWWIIDPNGYAFFIIGTDFVNYYAHWCEALGYAPYHKNCEQKYGSEQVWADTAVKRLLSWGFNSLGVGSSPSVRYQGLAYMEKLDLGTGFTEVENIIPKITWNGFPDVFDPRFPPYCDKKARVVCEPKMNDPWLIGYFIDNELEWHPWTTAGLLEETLKKPTRQNAKIMLVECVKTVYPSVAKFNAEWKTNIKSFNDILPKTNLVPPDTELARKLRQSYIRLCAEKYFSIATKAIKKYDPNHLILGCRFAGQAPGIWDIASKYCDVISVNCYRQLDLESGKFKDGFEQELFSWYKAAGKPLFITEWSFPALDSGLPCTQGAGQRVSTQKQRALAFTAFQKYLFSQAFIVGSDFFMWVDEPALGISAIFPENSNYGLVNEKDHAYELLTKAAAVINAQAYDLH